MDTNDIDWSELISQSLLQQLGREPTRGDVERLIAELKKARLNPEAAGIGRQLRAAGLTGMDNAEGMVLVQRIIDLTVKRLESMGATDPGPAPTSIELDLAAVTAQARLMLEPFLKSGAVHAQLAQQLKPQPEDYAKVFEAAYADVARQAYERIWKEHEPVPRPKAGQVELLLAAAVSDTIRDEGAPHAFPGGFESIRHALLPGRIWLCWKFVQPRQRLGMAFDGLVFIDDHFAWFPKAWRVLGRIDA